MTDHKSAVCFIRKVLAWTPPLVALVCHSSCVACRWLMWPHMALYMRQHSHVYLVYFTYAACRRMSCHWPMAPMVMFMKTTVVFHAGPRTGLDVHNVTHAISVRDLVSDTVHQFAPTYHNYVLYSNSGAKNAPKMQRPKPQLAKEVQERVKQCNYQDNANLLANMELGVHREEYERTTSDQDEGSPHKLQRSDSPALRREPTFTDADADDIFREGPIEEDEEGLEMSSASVHGHMTSDDGSKSKKKSNKVLMRQTTDDSTDLTLA